MAPSILARPARPALLAALPSPRRATPSPYQPVAAIGGRRRPDNSHHAHQPIPSPETLNPPTDRSHNFHISLTPILNAQMRRDERCTALPFVCPSRSFFNNDLDNL